MTRLPCVVSECYLLVSTMWATAGKIISLAFFSCFTYVVPGKSGRLMEVLQLGFELQFTSLLGKL